MSDFVFDRGQYDEVLSELFTRLWDCDENCCEPGRDYTLDLQGITTAKATIVVVVVVVVVV